MKKYGKITALIAGVVLALGFASCKADTDDDDDTSQPSAYYTVTFNSNGGTEVTSQKVESGKKATKPANPTKQAIATETYAFENWYTSTDNGTTLSDTAFDFNTPITKDITLYAKWAANAVTHTVSFDTKGGSDVASQTIVHGNKAAKPTNPTKAATEAETYAFDDWYTSTDGGATLSDTAFDFDTAIDKDITLYAKWTATAIHTVTFNTNGGTEVTSQKVESGKKATKPAAPTKTETETEAFVFAGWYTSTDGGTTLSETAFDFDTAIEGDITLYAKYDVYTIEYIELKDCSVIRTMFETLCEYDSSSYPWKFKKTITRFAKAEARPASAEYYLDAAGNRIPLWYDEAATTLYYYLELGKKMSLRTSDGKNILFYNMTDAISIETKDFDTSNVTNMGWMFSS
ncbi:InlB B-repeat-containing protein, partial [Treponema sp.]|uniref:InlB B-repeat-containing protein n=1 Tax=Treponema sp. TaxID=166 RepID=UPI0025E2FD3D